MLFFFSNAIQASSSFFNDGGTVSASQTVFLNETPAPLVETSAPTIPGPYEYLWMVSIPSDPVLNQWNAIPGATNSTLTFSGPLSVTSLFTRCVRLAGSNDNYVETNVILITVLNSLPIELISFDANDNGNGKVKLNWSTASERNNEYFQIETSIDGLAFNVLERIEGALNSDVVKTYSYVDDAPSYGNNYYRLKQVDTNGDFEYSDVISIKITSGFDNLVSIFPNPVSQELNVKINTPLNKEAHFYIINMVGQIVFESDVITETNYSINLENLTSGTYFIKLIESDKVIIQQKFVKLK